MTAAVLKATKQRATVDDRATLATGESCKTFTSNVTPILRAPDTKRQSSQTTARGSCSSTTTGSPSFGAASRTAKTTNRADEESLSPAWRVRLVGLSYTKKDERAERDVLGWVLCGGRIPPFTLRAEHFFSPFNRQVFVACSAARAKDGSAHPSRVLECLRFYGHSAASVATELAQLMRESLEFTEPPSFQSFLERAELRLRVMKLEREADELRKGLR